MYALVKGSFIVLGPIQFNYRLINSALEDDLNLSFTVGPLDYMNVPLSITNDVKILPVYNSIPPYNGNTHYPNMMGWEVTEELLTYNYEILEISLDKHKEYYKKQITDMRWNKEDGGQIQLTIDDNEITVSTNRETRSQLASKISSMSENIRRRFKFNNIWVEMSLNEMQTVIEEIDNYVQEQFDWEYTKHSEIDLCTDYDSIVEIMATTTTTPSSDSHT